MTQEIERLLKNHDSTYTRTVTNLEKRLNATTDLILRKLDKLLSSSNQENHAGSRESSRQASDGFRVPRHAKGSPESRTSFEPSHRERPRVAPSRAGWTYLMMPEAEAISGARLPTVPHVRLVPDLTIVSHDTTRYASMFEPLYRSLEKFISKISKSTERGERSQRTLKKPKSYKD